MSPEFLGLLRYPFLAIFIVVVAAFIAAARRQ